MLVGVTDTLGSEHKFKKYLEWLRSSGRELSTLPLSHKLGNASEFDRCDALLLTGGNDVDPSLYRGQVGHPRIEGVNRERDEFERMLLDRAMTRSLPVLGICRGLQLANVHFGGTLLIDLEESGYRSHRSSRDEIENGHAIIVDQESFLFGVTGLREGDVNSSHHQAVDKPGRGLRVAARSTDGVIEAMEFEDASARQFFLLVQWHPERMNDAENPFAKTLLQNFLHAAELLQQ